MRTKKRFFCFVLTRYDGLVPRGRRGRIGTMSRTSPKNISSSVGTNVVRVVIRPWPSCALNRELKHATFLSHGRQPEANILQARTLFSATFSK